MRQAGVAHWRRCSAFSLRWLLLLQSTSSVIVTQGLSCPTACGIVPDQGANPCLAPREAPVLIFNTSFSVSVFQGYYCAVPSRSVVSDSSWPSGLWPARLFSPWNFPGKNTGVGRHFLLQMTSPTQRLNLHLLRLYHLGSPSDIILYLFVTVLLVFSSRRI